MRGSFQGYYGRPGRGGLVKGKSPQTSSPEPALGSLLSTLSQTDFNTTAGKYESDSSITDCVTVTSYNWLDRAEPTIAVPGKPHDSPDPCLTDRNRQTCKVDTTCCTTAAQAR